MVNENLVQLTAKISSQENLHKPEEQGTDTHPWIAADTVSRNLDG